jgi:DNA-binding response OmpR family regulator
MPQKLIILIDDDPNMAYLLKFMLERDGYEVVHLSDGSSAKDFFLKDKSCDLIILDLMLPYVDGFELLQIIRATPNFMNKPVIVLSAKEQEVDVVRAFTLGCDDYVKKPFAPGEFRARVNRLMTKQNTSVFLPS